MEFVPDVTTLPPLSSTLTVGWLVQTAPFAPPPGCAVKANWVAVPKVIENWLLVAVESPLAAALRVYVVPAVPTIWHPAKVATPLTAVTGFVVQLNVAPDPGWLPIDRVIEALEFVPVVMTLPKVSSTLTVGWVVQAAPFVPPPGCVVKTSWEAVDGLMVTIGLDASDTEDPPEPEWDPAVNVTGPEVDGAVIWWAATP